MVWEAPAVAEELLAGGGEAAGGGGIVSRLLGAAKSAIGLGGKAKAGAAEGGLVKKASNALLFHETVAKPLENLVDGRGGPGASTADASTAGPYDGNNNLSTAQFGG